MSNGSNFSEVLVVGAGVSGIGAAYYLGRRGIPYQVLEAADDVGGVWRTQRWHGARSDSDFIQYCFSFKPHLSGDRLLGREQIHSYLREVVRELGILERIRFGARVTKAVFDPDDKLWRVHTGQGIFEGRFLFNGNGYFTAPHVPCFEGSESFSGELIHAFQLDASRRFDGQNVVLVGSGATAVSAAPALARVARSLTLVQRSPSYIIEMSDRAGRITRLVQRLHSGGLQWPLKALRYAMQVRDDAVFICFRRFPGAARRLFLLHWLGTVGREAVQRHFTPRYGPWQQRICVAVGLKALLKSGTIGMVTGEIARFEERSLVMKSGEKIACDVCVLATGFELDFVKFELFVGQERISTAGINHYKGILMGGVPNYFHPVGVWHSAWTRRTEIVTRYAVDIIAYMQAKGLFTVVIPRRELPFAPALTSGYVMRARSSMPRLHGVLDLPSIDNLFAYRFRPDEFNFS
jgi:cation diffusion facilitator CzcD-associated flavoprotein CzcO